MNLSLILKLVTNAAAIAEAGKRGLDAIRSFAVKSGASETDVAKAIADGRAAAAKLEGVADGILGRLDAEGK
jgi:hypothetical protein